MEPWLPPLGRQDSLIRIEWYAKVRHGPPFVSLAQSLKHTNGENVTEDFFVFSLHLVLGQKPD